MITIWFFVEGQYTQAICQGVERAQIVWDHLAKLFKMASKRP